MQLRDAQEAIPEIDKLTRELFVGLKAIPGTIARLAVRYLPNWGVRVSEENIGYVERLAREDNAADWKGGGCDIHKAIQEAIVKAGLAHGNTEMNTHLAKMIVPLIGHMLKQAPGKPFRICDIGAGDGGTTMALLTEMAYSAQAKEFESRCIFHMIEPSYRRVNNTREEPGIGQRLEEHALQPKTSIVVSTFEDHIESVADRYFDMFISNAVLHHMNTPTYLNGLHRTLKDGGFLVTGDWYTSMWAHPAFLVPVLRDLGMDPIKIRRFETYFEVKKGDAEQLEQTLTPEQRVANVYMRDYVRHLQAEMAPLSPKSKVKLLEAHQSFEHREDDLKNAGFMTDINDLRKKHDYFVGQVNVKRYYPTTDILCASIAAKRTAKAKN